MKRKKVLIFVCTLVSLLLVGVACIGIFYGNSTEELLGPYLYHDIMPKTIYRINGQIYVPLTIDPESGKMAEDIPYYIGSVSEAVQEMDFRTIIGQGTAVGKVEDDFLGTEYYDYHSDVYTIRTASGSSEDQEILMMPPGIYVARLTAFYSEHMQNDWEAYARELDILFDTKTRQEMGDSYYLLNTNFKNSRYYYAVGDPNSVSWHSFHKHLSFFYTDLKEIL